MIIPNIPRMFYNKLLELFTPEQYFPFYFSEQIILILDYLFKDS